jgi:hypothetical protein
LLPTRRCAISQSSFEQGILQNDEAGGHSKRFARFCKKSIGRLAEKVVQAARTSVSPPRAAWARLARFRPAAACTPAPIRERFSAVEAARCVRWRRQFSSRRCAPLSCCSGVFNMLRRYSRAFSRTTGRVRWSRSPGGVLCATPGSASPHQDPHKRRRQGWMPNRSMDEIAARASQYLEGEIEAAEFCDNLLHAIAHAGQGALIALAKAITDHAKETD